jgi:predicted small lipoprotein YifL
VRALLSTIAFAVLLAGCGYKTPLTLPKPKPGEKAAATKPSPTQNEKKPAGEP